MRTSFMYGALAASLPAMVVGDITDGGFIGIVPGQNVPDPRCKLNSTEPKVEATIMLTQGMFKNAKEFLDQVGMSIDLDGKFTWLDNEVFTGINLETTGYCLDKMDNLPYVNLTEKVVQVKSFLVEDTAPWGLQRISNGAGASGDPKGQDFTYTATDDTLGEGVDIYVIDTGVRTTHAAFQDRAVQGFTAFDSAIDGDGHGTHVAGTAASARFGVAQKANIIAVKVLGDGGSGSSADTIAGMDWVINNHSKRKGQPGFVGSIMSMSWGLQGTAAAVDQVIMGATAAGIHVSVAAGNDGADACDTTPAHLGGKNSAVVTVGSVNIQNEVSSFSNIGKCVDVYGPGEQILSAWNTGDNVINFLSGTSMATPANTGVMAYLMAQDPAKFGQNPAALKAQLLATARPDMIKGNLAGSQNLLLSNGDEGNVAVKKRAAATGSPAAWARRVVSSLSQRWVVVEGDSPLRF